MRQAREMAEYGYFYDALSGEFRPPSDLQGRTHTLARLMTATFKNGGPSHPHSYQESRTYTPGWAPISSVVWIPHGDVISSLTLIGNQSELKVVHGHDSNIRNVQVFTEDAEKPTFIAPLIGSSYNDIQEVVADLAQAFFNTVATE